VHHADDVLELVRPARAVVVPVQVLRLLEHGHVGLRIGDVRRHVADGQDRPFLRGVAARVEADRKVAR
jgi:hypothetical protein